MVPPWAGQVRGVEVDTDATHALLRAWLGGTHVTDEPSSLFIRTYLAAVATTWALTCCNRWDRQWVHGSAQRPLALQEWLPSVQMTVC